MSTTNAETFTFLNYGGEMGQLMREKDWSSTEVGTPETWPHSLRTTVQLLLNTHFPMFVWWGPRLITFYNDAYRIIAGEKHPHLLGTSGKEGWSEIWDDLSPLVDSVFKGIATWSEDQLLYIKRHEYVEETYFTFSYSPILDESGSIAGLFCAVIETTEKVLGNRKLQQSEQNLRSTIQQSPVAMCILKGPTFVVEIANERMYELWGREAKHMQHLPIFEGLPEVRDQGLEELLLHVFLTGETVTAQERPIQLPRQDRIEIFYINFVYQPFREADGTISGIIVVATDVTLQVRSRQIIEENEARTRLTVSSAQLGLYELNLEDGSFVHSPRLLEIFGLKQGQSYPYKRFTDSIFTEDLPIRAAAYEVSKQTGELLYEARIKRPDGSVRWIRLNGKYFGDAQSPRSLLGTVMDITEEKKTAEILEQKIEERTRELVQANEQLKQFTYAASHDLQEPLRKITFFFDKLLSSMGRQFGEADQLIVERIQKTTSRMRNLIDDLLAYSNTSFGVSDLVDVSLTGLLEEVLEDMEAIIIEKKAKVVIQALPIVKANRQQLRQLFQNLLSNAIKYHKKEEHPQVEIISKIVNGNCIDYHVTLKKEISNFYHIQVKDNGIGFDQEDAERIFQLFQRLHGKAEYDGTGVGLAIVKKVAEHHNGYVWAESSPGNGATFNLLLPVK